MMDNRLFWGGVAFAGSLVALAVAFGMNGTPAEDVTEMVKFVLASLLCLYGVYKHDCTFGDDQC
jgi:hypothetical protein